MTYRIAGIDVHKKMLAVAIADIAAEGEYEYRRQRFGATESELRRLAEWPIEWEVQEAVMESTAQYWRPVWAMLEQYWSPRMQHREGAGPAAGKLHLAQAQSNRGPRSRKDDFRDGERMVRRLVARELVLSFVPDPEQRLWRTLTHWKYRLTQDRVRFQNRLESLLEQMHIKLSGHLSDLLGVSGRRILQALAEGATDPAAIAALADSNLRATPEQLRDSLAACVNLAPVYGRLPGMELQQLQFLEQQMAQLEREIAQLLEPYAEAVERLAEVPGLGVESAQQIIAEVGPAAAVFPSEKNLASWIGVCPGEEISADEPHSTQSPKGQQQHAPPAHSSGPCRRQNEGQHLRVTSRRLIARMPYKEAIWAIAHRLCRLIWKILHQGIRYEERPGSKCPGQAPPPSENDPGTHQCGLSRTCPHAQSRMTAPGFSTLRRAFSPTALP